MPGESLGAGSSSAQADIAHEQIINVWRPLAYPAVDCPLALMDYRTLDYEKDLVVTDLIL